MSTAEPWKHAPPPEPCPFCDGPVTVLGADDGVLGGDIYHHEGRKTCPVGRKTVSPQDWNNRVARPASPASEAGEVIMRAGRCGHHYDEGCRSCRAALECTNAEMDRLRALSRPSSESDASVELLREAIRRALSCTPSIGTTEDGYVIQYDCGDPWGILRQALDEGGGDG